MALRLEIGLDSYRLEEDRVAWLTFGWPGCMAPRCHLETLTGSQADALSEGPSAGSQEDYLVLGPMFVRDIDAAEYEMSFKFELVVGHEWNMHLRALGRF